MGVDNWLGLKALTEPIQCFNYPKYKAVTTLWMTVGRAGIGSKKSKESGQSELAWVSLCAGVWVYVKITKWHKIVESVA